MLEIETVAKCCTFIYVRLQTVTFIVVIIAHSPVIDFSRMKQIQFFRIVKTFAFCD